MTDFSIIGWRTSLGEILTKGQWIWIDIPDHGSGVGLFSGILDSSSGATFQLDEFRFDLDPSLSSSSWVFQISEGGTLYAALLAARIVPGPLKPGASERESASKHEAYSALLFKIRAGDTLHMQFVGGTRIWWFENPHENVDDATAIRAIVDGEIKESGDSLFGLLLNSQSYGSEDVPL